MQLVTDVPREEQLAFNRKRWEEICADPGLAKIEGKIESNGLGQVLVMPPASGLHSYRTRMIQRMLEESLGGIALPECPVSTIDGVRAADVGWYSDVRYAQVQGQLIFETAPKICIEILSPRNSDREMEAKKQLYFDAGAEEVWICDLEGHMKFFEKATPDRQSVRSKRCPAFSQPI